MCCRFLSDLDVSSPAQAAPSGLAVMNRSSPHRRTPRPLRGGLDKPSLDVLVSIKVPQRRQSPTPSLTAVATSDSHCFTPATGCITAMAANTSTSIQTAPPRRQGVRMDAHGEYLSPSITVDRHTLPPCGDFWRPVVRGLARPTPSTTA